MRDIGIFLLVIGEPMFAVPLNMTAALKKDNSFI